MRKSNKKGFTLVELLVVIAIVAILAAVAVPTAISIVDKGHKSNYESLRDGIVNNIKNAAGLEGLKMGEETVAESAVKLDKANEYITKVTVTCAGGNTTFLFETFTAENGGKYDKFGNGSEDEVVLHNTTVLATGAASLTLIAQDDTGGTPGAGGFTFDATIAA